MPYTRSDDHDDHRFQRGDHYRLYISPHTHNATVICVQDFDYIDYDARRILSPEAWSTEDEAIEALTALVPALIAAHSVLGSAGIDRNLYDFMIAAHVRQHSLDPA